MNLQDKKLLITGVINRESIAYEVAKQAQEAGAEIVLTGFGRAKRMTDRSAAKLDPAPDVLELDVNKPEDIEAVADDLRERWGRVDGILHAIAFAPGDALGGNFLNTPPESAITAFQTSAYSLKALAVGLVRPVSRGGRVDRRARLRRHRRLAGLRLDGRREGGAGGHLALPGARPRPARRAREPGVAPARSARSPRAASPGFGDLADAWQRQAPLGWDVEDPAPVASTINFLLSDAARAITAEIIHVDGGFHAMGTALAPVRRRGRGVKPPVFLTGATGFLGMEVLARLLEKGDREVVALVRAPDSAAAQERLEGVMAKLWRDPIAVRRPRPGDRRRRHVARASAWIRTSAPRRPRRSAR